MKSIYSAIFALVLSLSAFSANAQNLALVLSFENYENGRDVRDALREHDRLLTAYRGAGYRTFGGRDRTKDQLRRLLRNFVEELDGADNAVIHINGQVATFGGESWILPSDTAADTLADLEMDGISVDFLWALLAKKPGRSALFLGLPARGFSSIRGVSQNVSGENMPDGVMMVSGGLGDVSNAVTRDFLKPGSIIIEALANNRTGLTVDGDIPYGLILAGEAATPIAPVAEEIEAALRLSRNQRRSIQADLTLLGYGLGTIDGVFGNATRRAITRWQRHERLADTGYLTRDQLLKLDEQADDVRRAVEGEDRAYWARTGANGTVRGLQAYLSQYPEGLFASRARSELGAQQQESDVEEWDRAANLNTLAAYQRYLQRYPDGVYNRLAKVRVQEFLANVPEPNDEARRIEERLRLDQSSRLLIELRLAGLGYRVGSADGNFNDTTRAAIRRYQEDRAVQVTGYVSAEMIRLLLLGR